MKLFIGKCWQCGKFIIKVSRYDYYPPCKACRICLDEIVAECTLTDAYDGLVSDSPGDTGKKGDIGISR